MPQRPGFAPAFLSGAPSFQRRAISQITSGTIPVASGTLGTWDTFGLANGAYILRLVLQDSQGRTDELRRSVTVANFKLVAPGGPNVPGDVPAAQS